MDPFGRKKDGNGDEFDKLLWILRLKYHRYLNIFLFIIYIYFKLLLTKIYIIK